MALATGETASVRVVPEPVTTSPALVTTAAFEEVAVTFNPAAAVSGSEIPTETLSGVSSLVLWPEIGAIVGGWLFLL